MSAPTEKELTIEDQIDVLFPATWDARGIRMDNPSHTIQRNAARRFYDTVMKPKLAEKDADILRWIDNHNKVWTERMDRVAEIKELRGYLKGIAELNDRRNKDGLFPALGRKWDIVFEKLRNLMKTWPE